MRIERGDVWLCDFDAHPDSRQNGRRPAVVVQTDHLNRVDGYPLTIVVPCSSKGSEKIPSHVVLEPTGENGLRAESFAKCEQIQTVPRSSLVTRWGRLSAAEVEAVTAALRRTLAI